MTTETPFTLGNLLETVDNAQIVMLRMDVGGEDRIIEIKGHAGALYEGMPDELLVRTYDMIKVSYDFDGTACLFVDC